MRNFKFLATAIVAVMLACVLAFASFAATTPFKDIDDKKNETLSDAVSLLAGLGVTKGVSETEFGTMQHVTRQQMAAFVYRLMKAGKTVEGGSNTTPFTDLEDSTYFGYISWANGTGVIKGTSATTFNPKGGIILQDAYTMVIRALGHEDDTYLYPFSYIDKAEELGLDEGLDSVVTYNTKLTRGDVAIILYNAFFAEMGKEETKQVERLIGNGTKWVLETKVYNPSLAEDVYDVEVGNFEVRATPKYAFNDSEFSTEYTPLCDEYDVDMLHLVAAEEDEPLKEIYCKFEDSGLSGAADDYIMNGVEVYYTYVEKDNKKQLDKVYFMNGSHRVLETTAATFTYVDAKEKGDYYKYTRGPYASKDDGYSDYEKTEGYLTVGSDVIYFFDAPYSYLKPKFTAGMDAETRYDLQNEKNVKLVDIKCLDLEKGTYTYYIDKSKPVDNAEDMMANLLRVFSRGAYKLKFFDVDSDGIYEYAHYMPATYGFMDGDDNMYFASDMDGNKPLHEENKGSDKDVAFKPTIYYNEANIKGASFNDGDMVVAYLNPAANMIEVLAVVKPYNGFISTAKAQHGQVKIDSTTFSTAYVYRAVEEFDDGSNHYKTYHLQNDSSTHDFFTLPHWSAGDTFGQLTDNSSVGEVFDIYAYKCFGYNCVLWYDHIEDATISFDMDELIIPVSDEDSASETFTKSQFDAKLGEKVHYVRAYVNGKVTYIPVDKEDMYPSLDDGYDGATGEYNLSDIIGQEGLRAYVDKICKFTKDSNGLYTLIPLLHAELDEEGAYSGISRDSLILVDEDSNKQYGNDLGYTYQGYFKKISGSKYELLSVDSDDTILGDIRGNNGAKTVKYFNLTSASRIVIKNTVTTGSEDEVEYLEFDATNFAGSTSKDHPLTNIQYILKSIPDTTTNADLVLLYAEATDFEFKTKTVKNGWRVVIDSTVAKDENGEYRHMYKVFNPYTGAVEENVPGADVDDRAKDLNPAIEGGSLIDVKKGEVDDVNPDVITVFDTSVDKGLVYITEYVADEGEMIFVPVEAVKSAFATSEICCGDELESFVDDYVYNGEYSFEDKEFKVTEGALVATALNYAITDNTVITVLKSDEPGADAFVEGEYILADVSVIEKAAKENKCYNEKVANKKGEYTTVYADYLKAYVYAEENADEGEIPEAAFIIIVVNGEEDLVFSDYDSNFYPKSHN